MMCPCNSPPSQLRQSAFAAGHVGPATCHVMSCPSLPCPALPLASSGYPQNGRSPANNPPDSFDARGSRDGDLQFKSCRSPPFPWTGRDHRLRRLNPPLAYTLGLHPWQTGSIEPPPGPTTLPKGPGMATGLNGALLLDPPSFRIPRTAAVHVRVDGAVDCFKAPKSPNARSQAS